MSTHGDNSRELELNGIESSKSVPSRYKRLYPSKEYEWNVRDPDYLHRLGAKAGPMNLQDKELEENKAIPAGYVFLGQFIAHDITFDPTSLAETNIDRGMAWNYRTPGLDLDCIYGSGPRVSPHLYDLNDRAKFLLSRDEIDVPRSNTDPRIALVADQRNAQTVISTQLHVAFLKFHNRLVDRLRRENRAPRNWEDDFTEAWELVRWHYQWIVIYDYLEKISSVDVDRFDSSDRFFDIDNDEEPFIPIEFSHAAFRIGHSQAATEYDINSGVGRNVSLFTSEEYRLKTIQESLKIDWSLFFDTDENTTPQSSQSINTHITNRFFALPSGLIPGAQIANGEIGSLPELTIARSIQLHIPSGQQVADAQGLKRKLRLDDEEIWKQARERIHVPEQSPAPLWFYVLREAETRADGKKLGRLGSNIVTRVIIDLIRGDRERAGPRRDQPDGHAFPLEWEPTLQPANPERGRNGKRVFTMADLLKFVEDPGQYVLER